MSIDTRTSGGARLDGLAVPVADTGRMAIALSGLMAQWLRGLTINAHERLALTHLWEHGPMTMSELGVRIPLSRAAVTALTDRLEALGYVQRTPDTHDRRRTVLSLNSRPAELISPMVEEFERAVEELTGSFSDDEQATIARWSAGLRDIAHEQAAQLRRRTDEELPSTEL